MKKLIFFVLVVVLAITACKKDDPEPELIMVSSVTLSNTTLTINVGYSENLVATILPDNADDKSITWSSSKESVATVDKNGRVTAVASGVATIMAIAANGKNAICEIVVPLYGGTTGALSWALMDDGTLTIRGEGSMLNFFNDVPWGDYWDKIKTIIISEGVTSIGERAFYSCTKLTSIIIPEGVTSIGESAFSGCQDLPSITIPESVTSIGDYAFYYCQKLSSITIPEGVTRIGDNAFAECIKLTSITIPEGVTSIGWEAFGYCENLTSITIPGSVTSIGRFAFIWSGLINVTIPEGVTNIGDGVFGYCKNLTSVTIMATTPPIIGAYNFEHNSDDTLYVPVGCVDLYKADAAWNSAFTTITEQP